MIAKPSGSKKLLVLSDLELFLFKDRVGGDIRCRCRGNANRMRVMQNMIYGLGFYGPMRIDPNSDGARRRMHFLSLAHWVEVHKLDAAGLDELRADTLLMPSVKEVLKFSQSNAKRWRTDWDLVKGKIMLQGLSLMHSEHPKSPLWGQGALLQEMQEIGISALHASDLVRSHAQRLKSQKVVFLGAGTAPNDEVNRRVRNLDKRTSGVWQLVHWTGRHGSWLVHDWADSQRIPIHYLDAQGSRLARARLDALIQQSDRFILFEKRGSRSMEGIAAALKRSGRAFEMAAWTDSQQPNMDLF